MAGSMDFEQPDVDNETMETSDTSLVLVPKLEKLVSYKRLIGQVFSALSGEMHSKAVEEFQTECLRLSMAQDHYTELISQEKWEDVFQVLLKLYNDDIQRVVEVLHEFIPKVIHDLQPEVRDKMSYLVQISAKNDQYFCLENEQIYGRQQELDELKKLVNFQKKQNFKLINICGMTGVGKSFLLKHFGSKYLDERLVPIYVDAKGMTNLSELAASLLDCIGCPPQGTESNMIGTFLLYLTRFKERYVIFIDDYSDLMSPANRKQALEFLHNFIKTAQQQNIQLKIIVTSQSYLLMTSEKTEGEDVKDIKSQMNSYSKDIHLKMLNNEAAKELLGASFSSFGYTKKEEILKLCGGHPFLLKLVGEAADMDYSVTAENTGLTIDDVEHVKCLVKEGLQRAFDKLSKRQHLILLAFSLFGRDAKLSALYNVLNLSQPRTQFFEDIKKQFLDQFWLKFSTSSIKEKKEKYTDVNAHHPLVLEFLRMKMDSCLENQSSPYYRECVSFKRRYIMYFVEEMVSTGKNFFVLCRPQQTIAYNLKSLSTQFMRIKPHVKNALKYMSQDPEGFQLLFFTGDSDPVLKTSSEICHIFLFFHYFHDCFDNWLISTIKEAAFNQICEPVSRESEKSESVSGSLLWYLYIILLTAEKMWGELKDVLTDKQELKVPKSLVIFFDLYSFGKAIYSYASGALLTLSSSTKNSRDTKLIEQRNKALGKALNSLELAELSPEWLGVRYYFSVHIVLLQADSTYYGNPGDMGTILESLALCRRARKYVESAETKDLNIAILQPLIQCKKATFRACEGNLNDAERDTKYGKAERLRYKLDIEYEKSGMAHSAMAATNLVEHATLMRNWAITKKNEDNSQLSEKYANDSVNFCKRAVYILELSPLNNKFELFRAYVDYADSCELCQYCTSESNIDKRSRCEKTALEFYSKAYGLIQKHYHDCHISTDEDRLNKLIFRFIAVLKKFQYSQMYIQKVEKFLESVRTGGNRLNLLGSSSSSSSSDDEFLANQVESRHRVVDSSAYLNIAQPSSSTQTDSVTNNEDNDAHSSGPSIKLKKV